MRNRPLPCPPLACLAAIALGGGLALAGPDDLAPISGAGGQPSPTLVDPVTGRLDDRPKIAGRQIGAAPRQHPNWTRAPASVPAAIAAAPFPQHYVHDGAAIEMPVVSTRLLVQLENDVIDGFLAADAADLDPVDTKRIGFGHYELVELSAAAPDPASVSERVDTLAQQASVGFVSPVFRSPEIDGGWLAVSRDVLVRVQPQHIGAAEAILAEAAPDLTIVDRDFAGLPGAYRLRSDAANGFVVLAAANRLALDPRFAWSEPDFVGTMQLDVVPNDPDFDLCWGLENTGQQGCCSDIDVDAETAWDIANGDFSVRVLVMDVGVDQNHVDINQLPGRDFTDGSAEGSGDGDPVNTCDRHGTSVAGIIAGKMNNDIGGLGIAPDSRVVSARIAAEEENPCDSDYAFYSSSFVANAINWGYNEGCLITNASFSVSTSAAIQDAYDDTWSNGMMHFAATGNDSDSSLNFPANHSTTLAVGSIGPDGIRSGFSNWGPGIDFVGPGEIIWTTDRTGAPGYTANGDFVYFSGTSAACPFVAGCAALLWSAFPDEPPVFIEFWMQNAARDLGALGYDTQYGWGLPQPRASLNGPGPFNNFCANSWPILAPVFEPLPFDTTQATAFTDEPQEWCELSNVGVSNSVWFAFFAPCDAVVDIDTNGSSYDTVLSMYVGACTFAFPIACDDDSGVGLDSLLEDVPVSGGNIYMIKVADYNLSDGGGMLDFNFAFKQPNDGCQDAIAVTSGSTEFCTVGATNSPWSPGCLAGGIGTDVWFTHTAEQTGDLTISLCGAGYDSRLAVYAAAVACPIFGQAQTIACNDDAAACGDGSSEVTVPVVAGETYTIRVGAEIGGPAGAGDLVLTYECAADMNGDGVVNVVELLALLGAWGSNDPAADLNDDGIVNVEDLLLLLGAWGSCG